MGITFALGIIAFAALVIVICLAAWARFFDPTGWRFDGRWVRRPRFALAIERVAFAGLDPLRALIVWLITTGVVLAFLVVPALAYLLGQL